MAKIKFDNIEYDVDDSVISAGKTNLTSHAQNMSGNDSKVTINGTTYNIGGAAFTNSVTIIEGALNELVPAPEPQQITVNWLGTEPSYGQSFYITYNNQSYYYGDTFTATTGDDLYFSETQGSVSWNVKVNGTLLSDNEWSSFAGPWTIPMDATSITINSIEYSGHGILYTVDITYTTN